MRSERAERVVPRFAMVTLALPALVVAIGLLIQLDALARMPVYSGGLEAPAWLPPATTVVIGLGLPTVIGLSSIPSLRHGDRSPAFRVFGAQALGISALQTTIATTLVLHRSVTASGEIQLSVPLCAGIAGGIIGAVVGWFLQPAAPSPTGPRAITPLELTPTERAGWIRTAFLPMPAVAVIIVVSTIVGLKADLGWVAGDRPAVAAILTLVAALLLALLATTAAFRIRVDAHGLNVRSSVGIPRFRVALPDVESVAVLDVRSLGVPGSWGIRVGPRRTTIVMRSTTGIRVMRRNGRALFVTVDDAATGAALLQALAVRAGAATAEPPRSSRPPSWGS